MKTLLPGALEDSREYLHPLQKANGIPAGMDAMIHDVRMINDRFKKNTDYAVVSVDASNAFNRCSRQRFLEALPDRAPSLARFCNLIYASVAPPLVIPSSPPEIIKSFEGTQQGDPPSMLLFSLATHELFRKIEEECHLPLNVYYADDGIIAGPIAEIKKALQLLQNLGPEYQFFVNMSKTRAYVPSGSATTIAGLTELLPEENISSMGISLLGIPIGKRQYIDARIREKLDSCAAILDSLKDIPDARIKFHMHRVTASACKVYHLFRLTNPRHSLPHALKCDEHQLQDYSLINEIPMSPAVSQQVQLPFRFGGHGLTAVTPLLHASYASSLIAAAPHRIQGTFGLTRNQYLRTARPHLRVIMQNLPPHARPPVFTLTPNTDYHLGAYEPESTAQRPEGTHCGSTGSGCAP